MATYAEERALPTRVEALAVVADPAPLGLAAFALTTFLLSGHNASFIPDVICWKTTASGSFYGKEEKELSERWGLWRRTTTFKTALCPVASCPK